MNYIMNEKLHESYEIIESFKIFIQYQFLKESSDSFKKFGDFEISSDSYDNSLEIYFNNFIENDWEPSESIRREIYKLGFSIFWFNFKDEKTGKFTNEVCGCGSRREKGEVVKVGSYPKTFLTEEKRKNKGYNFDNLINEIKNKTLKLYSYEEFNEEINKFWDLLEKRMEENLPL